MSRHHACFSQKVQNLRFIVLSTNSIYLYFFPVLQTSTVEQFQLLGHASISAKNVLRNLMSVKNSVIFLICHNCHVSGNIMCLICLYRFIFMSVCLSILYRLQNQNPKGI